MRCANIYIRIFSFNPPLRFNFIFKAIMCLEKVLTNRLLSYFNHSRNQGTATRDDIDTTLKLGMNHPMGPLQLGAFDCVFLLFSFLSHT
jgi:hypothetical protein